MIDQLTQNLGGEPQSQQESHAPFPGSSFGFQWGLSRDTESQVPLGGNLTRMSPTGVSKSLTAEICLVPQLRAANLALLEFLEDWSREPDDKGEDWWRSFEEQLEENRQFAERSIE